MTIFALLGLFLFQWASLCFTVIAIDGEPVTKEVPFLVIEPISSREYGLYVIKRVQDTLNLTCRVFDNSTEMEPRYNITWSTPSSATNSKNRVVIQSSINSVNLVVPHLETRDQGEYSCSAQSVDGDFHSLSTAVTVNIKSRKCGDKMFMCSSSRLQNCIPQRFKCDGHQDCQYGEDEDQEVCGDSPCMNKYQCEDPISTVVRCIPKSWCCNVRIDVNCTIREPLSCCPHSHITYLDERSYYPTEQHHFNDMTFLQTTVYTIIGCAMVFMIVVTVLVIAICRAHMKRSLMTQCPTNLSHSGPQPQLTSCGTQLYDLDVYLNRGCGLDSHHPPGFLVTYNINNGVQIVGHAIDPPPYSEVVALPPREGPPPPYTSHETLDQAETEALLQQNTTSQCVRIGEESGIARTDGLSSEDSHTQLV